jgi:hypothetical protein
MANTVILLKKSGVSGNVPGTLVHGEVALNWADGKLYYENGVGTKYITNQKTFDTINVNSSLIIATSFTDTLSLNSSNGITLSTNTTSKTITIDDGITYAMANTANTYAQVAYEKANIEFIGASGISVADQVVSNQRQVTIATMPGQQGIAIDWGFVYQPITAVTFDWGTI